MKWGGEMKQVTLIRRLSLAVAATLFFGSSRTIACTAVSLPLSSNGVVAKSYDWDQGHGTVVLNQSGLEKSALVFSLFESGAKWKAVFPSLTFNQVGREFPLGGVNSAGLTVEVLWLSQSEYPNRDFRPVINELQWIQYQLDRFSTVAEVAANADSLRVSKVYADVHYLACDATGACATFEYIGGKLVVHIGSQVTVPTLTNDTYDASAKHLANFDGFGGRQSVPADDASLSRFVRASALAKDFTGGDAVAAAFSLLDSVGGTSWTKFHIVYEPKEARAHFRTLTHKDIKFSQLSNFNLTCEVGKNKTLLLDMNQALSGDVSSHFVPYSKAQNRAMIDEALNALPPGSVPLGLADRLASYPDSARCAP